MTSMDHIFADANLIRNQPIGKRLTDPLPRLLAQLVDRAGGPANILRATSRPWASALFQGRRHTIEMRIEGADADRRKQHFADGLDSAEWTLIGHFMADITIDDQRRDGGGEWLELSALTIEDW